MLLRRLLGARGALAGAAAAAAAASGAALARSPPAAFADAPAPEQPPTPAGAPRVRLQSSIGSDREAPHFRVYTGAGELSSLDELVERVARADVVLVGEAHDDPVAHQLELYLLVRLHRTAAAAGRRLVLSLEQFERDVQAVLDEYTAGAVREQDMLLDARPWANYAADYRPLVEYARAAGLRVLAANAPRRYVSAAGSRGRGALEALSAEARAWLPPLPLPAVSEDYVDHFRWAHQHIASPALAEGGAAAAAAAAGASGAAAAAEADGGGGCPYIGLRADPTELLDPMVLWDASMAHAIATAARGGVRAAAADTPTETGGAAAAVGAAGGGGGAAECVVLHVCGSFHAKYRLGIGELLAHYWPADAPSGAAAAPPAERGGGGAAGARQGGALCATVVIYPVEAVGSFDARLHSGAGDFVILTDASLPRSHEVQHPL